MSDEVIIGLIIYNAVVSSATLVWLGRNVWTRFQVKRPKYTVDLNAMPTPLREDDQMPYKVTGGKASFANAELAYRATPRHPEEKAPVKPIKGQWGAIRERVEASE